MRLFLVLFVLLGCVPVGSWGEIVQNGGFEDRDPEKLRPASWHHNARNATDIVEMGWGDRESAHSGEHCISIHIKDGYPEEKKQITWMWTSRATGLAVGETYRLRAWIRTQDLGFTPTVLVQFCNSDDEFLSRADTHSATPITGTTDWTEVSAEFVVPPNTTHVKIRAAMKALENTGGTVWFDDLSLDRVER
jgi:hypothetical protein